MVTGDVFFSSSSTSLVKLIFGVVTGEKADIRLVSHGDDGLAFDLSDEDDTDDGVVAEVAENESSTKSVFENICW